MKKLKRTSLKAIQGGEQGSCTGYCVPKINYSVECVNGWCVYKYVGPQP